MTDTISISLSNIRNTKHILIEGLGEFTVRKMGAGEELDLSKKMRRFNNIIDELDAMDFTQYDVSTPEGVKSVSKLEKRMTELSEEIADIKRFELETYKGCFEDDNGGKNVEKLLNTLSESERAVLFTQIFGEKKQVEAENPVKPEAEDESNS